LSHTRDMLNIPSFLVKLVLFFTWLCNFLYCLISCGAIMITTSTPGTSPRLLLYVFLMAFSLWETMLILLLSKRSIFTYWSLVRSNKAVTVKCKGLNLDCYVHIYDCNYQIAMKSFVNEPLKNACNGRNIFAFTCVQR